MSITLVNPCIEQKPQAARAPRLKSLTGKTIALLDISKPGGNVFLDRIERLLLEQCSVAHVVRESKPTYTKPAPEGLLDKLRKVDAVVEGLAD